jgi:hypothetical protein
VSPHNKAQAFQNGYPDAVRPPGPPLLVPPSPCRVFMRRELARLRMFTLFRNQPRRRWRNRNIQFVNRPER